MSTGDYTLAYACIADIYSPVPQSMAHGHMWLLLQLAPLRPLTYSGLQLLTPWALEPLGLSDCQFYLRTCTQNREPLTQEISQRWNLIGKQDMLWWSGHTSVLTTHCWYSTRLFPIHFPTFVSPSPSWFNLSAIMTSMMLSYEQMWFLVSLRCSGFDSGCSDGAYPCVSSCWLSVKRHFCRCCVPLRQYWGW